MKATEAKFLEFLKKSPQFVIPIYQRTYSWSKPQLSRLWDDILALAEDRADHPNATHFIGSLVLAQSPTNGPS